MQSDNAGVVTPSAITITVNDPDSLINSATPFVLSVWYGTSGEIPFTGVWDPGRVDFRGTR